MTYCVNKSTIHSNTVFAHSYYHSVDFACLYFGHTTPIVLLQTHLYQALTIFKLGSYHQNMNIQPNSGEIVRSGTDTSPIVSITEKKRCSNCKASRPLAAFSRYGCVPLWKTCNKCFTRKHKVTSVPSIAPPPRQRPLTQVQAQTGQQHRHASLSNDEMPALNTSQDSVTPRSQAIPKPVRSFQGYEWPNASILHFDPSSESPKLEHALMQYTLSINLLEVSQRWRPRKTQTCEERLDILREINTLLSLMDSGRITPWQPFRAWFEWYRAERAGSLAIINTTKARVEVFEVARTASEQLAAMAKGQMEAAAEELPLEDRLRQLERFLSELKADVVKECEELGCLGLRNVLTKEDIRVVKFSKSWKPDGSLIT